MQKLFNKILVPVDFSQRSLAALEKATDVAVHYQCSITILYVESVSLHAAYSVAEGHVVIPPSVHHGQDIHQHRLDELVKDCRTKHPSISIHWASRTGSWNESIISYVQDNKIDLVMIGQTAKFHGKRKMQINPDKIALQTKMPVITIPANKKLNGLSSVLIPITDFLPVRKLMYGIYIAKMNDSKLKLLAIKTGKTREACDYYLKKAYQLINDNCQIAVDMESIESDNTADGITQFIHKHPSDMLILNPGTQTRMHGFLSNFFGRIIQKYVHTPVMTITPLY